MNKNLPSEILRYCNVSLDTVQVNKELLTLTLKEATMASILEQVWEYKKFSELTPTAAEKAIKQTTLFSLEVPWGPLQQKTFFIWMAA